MSNKKKDDAVWEDCGCPLSMAGRKFVVDTKAPIPHKCTIGKDEHTKHYIFDRTAYEKITQTPGESPLGEWVAKRCKEKRMFVAKPPDRPLLPPVPWRYDEPPLDWSLPPGWQMWEPTDPSLTFSDQNPLEDYEMNLNAFFLYMNINNIAKQNAMRDGVEAWVLACGESDATIDGKQPSKINRCFVTSNRVLYAYLVAAGSKLDNFLRDLKIPSRMGHMRRLLDIRIDAKIRTGGCGHTSNP